MLERYDIDNKVDFQLDRIKKWCNGIKIKMQVDLKESNSLSKLSLERDLTKAFKQISASLQSFNELYEKAEANPDSVINYMKYQKALDGFYWAWPYGITGEKIKNILEKCQTEIDFDRRMQNIFKDI